MNYGMYYVLRLLSQPILKFRVLKSIAIIPTLHDKILLVACVLRSWLKPKQGLHICSLVDGSRNVCGLFILNLGGASDYSLFIFFTDYIVTSVIYKKATVVTKVGKKCGRCMINMLLVI